MKETITGEKIFKGLNLCIPVLIGLFIFLNPFPFTTAVKEICFYSSVVMVLILACFRKLDFSFRSPLTIPFLLFALWAFIGLFFALDRGNSIHDYQTHLLKYLAFYFILINYFRSRERLFYLSGIIMVSAALFSVGEIVYFYGILGRTLSTKLVTGLPEVAVNWVGIIAVPAAVFSLHNIIADNRRNVKAISFVCLFSTFAVCILTQARSTVLALFLSGIILFFKNRKIMVACLGIVLIFTLTTSIKDRFTDMEPVIARLSTYCITYEVIKDYPVMGIGFGMETYGSGKHIDLEAYSKRIPEKHRGYIYTDPHSMPFSIAVRTGLIGLVLFFYILFASFKMGWISIRQGKDDQWGVRLISAFVAILVIGLFEPFFSHVPEVVFFTILAMITIVWKWGDIRAAQ
ncbi:MAG: O-antigen ligase family protein [Deltaproteobacteria bacterium]|nr:O-antigen ligase family protein [Deltaproteobacteria bacterium]